MFKVNEGSSARVSFIVEDHDGSPVPVSNISTATMSLVDYDTNEIIIASQDIKSNITELGVCTFYLSGDTNRMVTETKPYEKHILSILVSGVGLSSTQITSEIIFQVNNIKAR